MKLRSRTTSVLSAIVTLASAGGLVALYAPSDARAAGEGTDSAVTVKWAGGNGDLQRFQPDRSHMVDNADGSGHWEDFKDLEVTVSQTEGLIDQTVTVTATGMAPSVRPTNNTYQNFLQMFQCWGPDPEAPGFAETCQYGSYAFPEVGGMANELQGSFNDVAVLARGTDDARALPFRAVTGQVSEHVEVVQPGEAGTIYRNRGLGAFFTASSSNELPLVPVDDDGARVGFVTQSAAAQPYLGCGDPEAAGERCWLVVVPRGTHSGSLKDAATKCVSNVRPNNGFGDTPLNQFGSPIGTDCSFWANRMVVPLDFRNPFVTCPPGSAERRVVGSELVAHAMSSWQPALCADDDGATFSLNTSSGNQVRGQLLTGQANLAAVSLPLTPETIGSTNPELLDGADIGYAPLANSALTISFYAAERGGRVVHDLRLTPRLVAKMLTQSYRRDVPQPQNGNPPVSQSLDALKVEEVVSDEEWVALGNPTELRAFAPMVVPGPQGDDAIQMLWEYIQADADARAFLSGAPDPWGNVVNPYYLPSGHSGAAGGGYPVDLSVEPIDMFPKADRTQFPDAANDDPKYKGAKFGSESYVPYSTTLEANASRIARRDHQRITGWDPDWFSGLNSGRWAPSSPIPPGGQGLLLGPALAPSAELFRLDTAALAQPLDEFTTARTVASAREFVEYDPATVTRAVAGASLDKDGLTNFDVTALPDGAYPLTTTVHAAVNLNQPQLDRQARVDYAGLLEYAAADGNVVTGDRGGLPEGYVPLTDEQQEAALDLADRLLAPPGKSTPTDPDETDPDGDGGNGDETSGGSADPEGGGPGDTNATVPVPVDGVDPTADGPPSGPGSDDGPGTDTTTTQDEAVSTEDTTPLGASVALGGTLIAGLAGMVGAPFLMRRRDMTG
ncbi:hypothetical protein [Promicromonospora panici]|uniref:hypothetical protein n=1 Tax=Promicromonospora panici TaxID=2219658 RepID=UPI00101BB721|nr:hypothetical protein [Promicromonospora panici]